MAASHAQIRVLNYYYIERFPKLFHKSSYRYQINHMVAEKMFYNAKTTTMKCCFS